MAQRGRRQTCPLPAGRGGAGPRPAHLGAGRHARGAVAAPDDGRGRGHRVPGGQLGRGRRPAVGLERVRRAARGARGERAAERGEHQPPRAAAAGAGRRGRRRAVARAARAAPDACPGRPPARRWWPAASRPTTAPSPSTRASGTASRATCPSSTAQASSGAWRCPPATPSRSSSSSTAARPSRCGSSARGPRASPSATATARCGSSICPRRPTSPQGDVVVTAGIDGVYPPGLAVGRIDRVERAGTAYRQVVIRPFADFSRLEAVLVLVAPARRCGPRRWRRRPRRRSDDGASRGGARVRRGADPERACPGREAAAWATSSSSRSSRPDCCTAGWRAC